MELLNEHDGTLLHTTLFSLTVSYESGILEKPSTVAPSDLYQMTSDPEKAPDRPHLLTIHFKAGENPAKEQCERGEKERL